MIESNNFFLKNVTEDDVIFLLKLRTNKELSKYLSPVSWNVEAQKKWIKEYQKRYIEKKEFYFKVIDKNDNDVGFARLYNVDLEKKTCTFGSFILKEDRPKTAAIETMVALLKFAFSNLNLEKVELDVRVKNEHAKKFYNRFGFRKTDENALDEFYEITKKEFMKLYDDKYCEFIKDGSNQGGLNES